jgi:DNA-binding PucR family transcriptional regulator
MEHVGMALTFRQLLVTPELHLKLVYDGDNHAMDSGIIWVHPTDVINAADFAEPGEILLTCSTNFPLESMSNANDLSLLKRDLRKAGLPVSVADVEAAYNLLWMKYVADLSRAGVMAIGFGVKMKHPSIPQALLRAVKEHHIILFEVPEEINFSVIVKTVLRRQAEESESVQRMMYAAQRDLFRATDSPDVVQSVIQQSAKLVDGWAAFLDSRSRIVAISNQAMRHQATQLALHMRQQEEQRANNAKAIFGIARGRNRYYMCVVEHQQQRLGTIIVSSLGSSGNNTVSRAVGVAAADALSWSLPPRIEQYRRQSRIRDLAFEELAAGHTQMARTLMDELGEANLIFPAQLFCIEHAGTDDDFAFTLAGDVTGMGSMVGRYQDHLWILVSQPRRADVESMLDDLDSTVYGSCAMSAFSTAPEAFRQALRNLRLRRIGSHESVVDLSPHELVSPDIAAVYADELFALVRKLPPGEQQLLMTTLRELLFTAFNVGAAAKRLEVHRHTVENRMSKLESLLGLDFNDESARVKVWIACSFIRDGEMSTSR